jgi:glycosyltransferase involved in cell wall biosynthesis
VGPAHVLNVAAITGGQDVPSARFRVRQYLPELLTQGVAMTELESRSSAYPPTQRWLRPAWAAVRLTEMAGLAMQSRRFDVTFLQREMLSTFATLERWTGRPRVLDVDDAIHLYRGGGMAKTLAMQCDRIICGNPHLAEIYRQWNRDVVVLPTAVDTERYCPRAIGAPRDAVVLGWIGTSANLRYLHDIEPALLAVMEQYPHVKLHVVCDKPPQMRDIPPERLQFTPWSAAIEVTAIQTFSIGLMPLEDSDWARGKCSYKMLQYMACGLPVVVSPVGMNADVLKLGDIGYGAATLAQWVDVLVDLVSNDAARLLIGLNGRQIVVKEFSVSALAPRLAVCLSSVDCK